jgi:hypothetical protein
MMYREVAGATIEEYGANLLAYAGQRITKVQRVYGDDSPEVADALARWSEIYRLQIKMWPDTQDISALDGVPHQHDHFSPKE